MSDYPSMDGPADGPADDGNYAMATTTGVSPTLVQHVEKQPPPLPNTDFL